MIDADLDRLQGPPLDAPRNVDHLPQTVIHVLLDVVHPCACDAVMRVALQQGFPREIDRGGRIFSADRGRKRRERFGPALQNRFRVDIQAFHARAARKHVAV